MNKIQGLLGSIIMGLLLGISADVTLYAASDNNIVLSDETGSETVDTQMLDAEDGEPAVREAARKTAEEEAQIQEENQGIATTRINRYLSSGVNSTDYVATEKQGVDVSRHQKTIDWNQVRASGMEFAMIRVGFRGYEGGKVYPDEYFDTNVQNALAAGMKVGIYFFSQALTSEEALEEAKYTIDHIKKYGTQITYPVVFDWETADGYRTNLAISKQDMGTLTTAFCDTIKNAGYIPMVYSNTVDFQNRFDYNSIASRYYIWYARYLPEYGGTSWYTHGNRMPNYDNNIKFNMWQYMSDGTVPGITGNCDVNVTFLDFATKRHTTPVTPVTPTINTISLTASDKNIVIDENDLTVTGLSACATLGELRSCFGDFYISCNGCGNTEQEHLIIKTGDCLVFSPKAAYTKLKNSQYTYYLSGDVYADGDISVLDMEGIQKHVLGMETLTGVRLKAAKVTGNSEVSVLDMEALQKQILGME